VKRLYRALRHRVRIWPVFAPLRWLYRWMRRLWQDRRALRHMRRQVEDSGGAIRVIIGASGTAAAGWITTEYPLVNVAELASLQRVFRPGTVSAILAEHVWEHLTPAQALAGARNCHALLKPGGHFRIAVPDGLHTDPAYIEYARPGGSGEGSDDHKVFYTHRSLGQMLQEAGFEVRLLEWFDEKGVFHAVDWDPAGGYVDRSTRFDDRNRENPTAYTSLIADAFKPAG
jgi:predicted SAM-dependent methyltransferase